MSPRYILPLKQPKIRNATSLHKKRCIFDDLEKSAIMKGPDITTLLNKASLRVTKTRRDVLALLLSTHDRAISSHDIEVALPGIDRITLYRILKAFEEGGLIHAIADSTAKTKYAICRDGCVEAEQHQHNHVHFHCRSCDQTTCLDGLHAPAVTLPGSYHVEGIQYLVHGLCAHCL